MAISVQKSGRQNKLSMRDKVFIGIVACILLLTLIGPWIAPYDLITANPSQRLVSPSFAHLFGTDENGLDIFSRVLASPRIDALVALAGTALSLLIGAPIGVLIGYAEGRGKSGLLRFLCEIVMRIVDVIQAFPVFILAMVLVAMAGSNLINIVAAIAFVNAPVFLRLVRAEILSLREHQYAEAAIAIGASPLRVGFVHLLPNALPTVLSQVSVTIGFAILLTAGLSFVGAGISPPTPELGSMIASGAKYMILGQWWPSLFPGLALGFIVFSFASVGDTLKRLLEPAPVERERSGLATTTTWKNASPKRILLSASARDLVLGVRNVTMASDERRILSDISFDVREGETIGIVGESGSGKSMLVNGILGIPAENLKFSGEVFVHGKDISKLDPKERRLVNGRVIAPVLSNPKMHLNPLVRIGDFMQAAMTAHVSIGRDEAFERCVALLTEVGITDPARRMRSFPHELSGGMAQRVCLALALMHRPKIIIADEPTAGLDVTVQRQVLDLMSDLCRRNKMAQIIVTRDLGIVAHYCDRILIMRDGIIVEEGETRGVFAKPQETYTNRLLSASGYRRLSHV